MRSQLIRTITASVLALTILDTLDAAPMAFTDRAEFDAVVAALANVTRNTLDVEGFTSGDHIAGGGSLDGITYNYPDLASLGIDMQVSSGFDSTSSSDYPGTSDDGLFLGGDNFSLDFGPVNAIGIYYITANTLFDGDIALSAGGGSATWISND